MLHKKTEENTSQELSELSMANIILRFVENMDEGCHLTLTQHNICFSCCHFFIVQIACLSDLLVFQLTSEDLRDVEEAIENMGVEQRKLYIEEQELAELKSELADYQEDIEDFRKVRNSLILSP